MLSVSHGMVLCAGFGTRMRPLTAQTPKALLEVGGRSILMRSLDQLRLFGVRHCVVNAYYLADRLLAALADYDAMAIDISIEDAVLESGGGVQRALSLLGETPFFVINGDILWRSAYVLSALCRCWDATKMDAALVVAPCRDKNEGVFRMTSEGRLYGRGQTGKKEYLFTGIQLLAPRLFRHSLPRCFSLRVLYDLCARDGRLFGVVYDGTDWLHVSTPQDLAHAERHFREDRNLSKS